MSCTLTLRYDILFSTFLDFELLQKNLNSLLNPVSGFVVESWTSLSLYVS